ncbi:acyl carrier protein [Roseiconus lacunae]|uniref:acyl carrier protein n=1 Tax=Roseiconus lacunae TaxID=2605694 RepID=UPI001E2CE33F|nr:acyl carrier protein [Roseiconus lacunae]MCD0458150.1 acyl carrier protein [Roseiconus lacunae]
MNERDILIVLGEELSALLGVAIPPRADLTAADIEGWDSMEHVRVIVSIEKRFNIRITAEESASFQSLGDISKLISNKLT